eukprot:1160966-Pelagomonas_calceolata.AAC.6
MSVINEATARKPVCSPHAQSCCWLSQAASHISTAVSNATIAVLIAVNDVTFNTPQMHSSCQDLGEASNKEGLPPGGGKQ